MTNMKHSKSCGCLTSISEKQYFDVINEVNHKNKPKNSKMNDTDTISYIDDCSEEEIDNNYHNKARIYDKHNIITYKTRISWKSLPTILNEHELNSKKMKDDNISFVYNVDISCKANQILDLAETSSINIIDIKLKKRSNKINKDFEKSGRLSKSLQVSSSFEELLNKPLEPLIIKEDLNYNAEQNNTNILNQSNHESDSDSGKFVFIELPSEDKKSKESVDLRTSELKINYDTIFEEDLIVKYEQAKKERLHEETNFSCEKEILENFSKMHLDIVSEFGNKAQADEEGLLEKDFKIKINNLDENNKNDFLVRDMDINKLGPLLRFFNIRKYKAIINLNEIRQKIIDIEVKQNETIRSLEMEKVLVDIEQNNEFERIHYDEMKVKSLLKKQLTRTKIFELSSSKIREEIFILEDLFKKLELDLKMNLPNKISDITSTHDLFNIKRTIFDEARKKHEDLEFQLMEMEAKYESDIEEIQNQLAQEKLNLSVKLKKRKFNINDYGQHNQKIYNQVKEETECLEWERQKLIKMLRDENDLLLKLEKKMIFIKLIMKEIPLFFTNYSIKEKTNYKTEKNDFNLLELNNIKKYKFQTTPDERNDNYCHDNQISRHNFNNREYKEEKILVEERLTEDDNCNSTTYNSIESSKYYNNQEKGSDLMIVDEKWLNDFENTEDQIEKDSIKGRNVVKLRPKSQIQTRPLTRYLPVRDNNFDLIYHIESSGHSIDLNSKNINVSKDSCRGFLFKMGLKYKTWNKRWFVFDRKMHSLSYFTDKQEQKLRKTIKFSQINEVYVDHMKIVKSIDPISTFIVKTEERVYYLVAPTPETMRIWVDVIFTGAEGYFG